MSLIKNPNELANTQFFSILIYGQPGVGKSTLALSAPNPVMIDADNGMRRVQKRYQVPSLQLRSYREFLALLQSDELNPYTSIVFDTLGKFVDMIGDYLGQENPKNRKSDGALTMQGYGALKVEFARVIRLVKEKGKHLVFVAHEREEKDGDNKIVRPDVSGSSGKDLVKDLDCMGYMEMRGNKRTISFSPTEKYYAKNSLGLPDLLDVSDPDAIGNIFIQKHIIEQAAIREKEADEQNKKYEALMLNLEGVVKTVVDPKTADEALATIGMSPVIWDSQRVAKHKLNERTKALGLVYDKDAKGFKLPEVPKTVEAA